jgi:hypothetical protein
LANGSRNTGMLLPIDDIDLTAAKRFTLTERANVEFSARFFNILNHSQYTGGFLNDVAPNGATTVAQHNFLIPTDPIFANPSQAFSSNPRSMTLALKITF